GLWLVAFFFSSRRRHTRFSRDWSSDVCSSDLSEILRGAIGAIDRGQWEAAASIGMSGGQTLRRVILPQAARTALPPMGNSFISLVKDTSLAATIQVPELFRQAQLITARTFEIFTLYLAAALIYWVLASGLSWAQHRLELRASRHSR